MILSTEFPVEKGVRLLGVTLSSLTRAGYATASQFMLDLERQSGYPDEATYAEEIGLPCP